MKHTRKRRIFTQRPFPIASPPFIKGVANRHMQQCHPYDTISWPYCKRQASTGFLPLLALELGYFSVQRGRKTRENDVLGYRTFTTSSLGLGVKWWDWLGARERKKVDKQGCLGLAGTTLEGGTIKVKDILLAQAIEEKRAADAKTIKAFGGAPGDPGQI